MFGMSYEQWLCTLYRPLGGMEETPEEIAAREAAEAAAAAAGGDGEGGEGAEDGENEGGEGGDDDNDAVIATLKADHDKTKQELAAAQAAIRKSKAEAAAARSKAAAENGNWEQVAKESQAELANAREELAAAKEAEQTATGNLDDFQRQVRVTSLAVRLGFKDPTDAMKMISSEDSGDDKSAERALRKLATEKDYLVDPRKATGRNMNGTGSTSLLTKAQMDAMSPSEINGNWELVQRSMSALQAATV